MSVERSRTRSSHGIALTVIASGPARGMPHGPTVPAVLIGSLGREAGSRGQAATSPPLYTAIARGHVAGRRSRSLS
jgi:hypothetical protein